MELSVMQWNIWYKQNIDEVLDFLRKNPADIICLQELTRGYIDQSQENTWEYIAHGLGYEHYVQQIPIINPGAQWSQANAIFSRFPVQAQSAAWLHEPDDPEGYHDQYRGYLEIMLHDDDSKPPVAVATTHMSFSPDLEPEKEPELQELLTLIDRRPERFILTGDMNVLPNSRRIAEILHRLRNAGPPFDEPTWPTKPFGPEDTEPVVPNKRLDYIFATPDIELLGARILQTDTSDHLPVIARLRV